MTKGHTRQFVKKQLNTRPETINRELPPRFVQGAKDGVIQCPFCEIPHPIAAGSSSACGTTLKISALQTIYPARTVRKHNLICVKCARSGGEMVRFNNGFVHLAECSPNTKLMAVPPKFSPFAKVVFGLPASLRKALEARLGLAKEVREIDPDGKETGRTLGYFFFRGRPQPEASPEQSGAG